MPQGLSRACAAAGLAGAIMIAESAGSIRPTLAQYAPTPQYMCQQAAQASQTGGPGLYSVFGQQLLQIILQQTGGTGVYVPLVQLGQITNIIIGGVNPLPNGTFVSCRVMHVNGYSDWQIGFSPYTQRIENSVFVPYWTAAQVMPQQQTPQYTPSPTQAPPSFQTPPSQPTQAPTAPTQSEACRKFPNLC